MRRHCGSDGQSSSLYVPTHDRRPHSNPGCGSAEVALNTVIAESKYPEDLWAALGKPLAMGAVEELIEAAARADPSFQKQVQAIWETGALLLMMVMMMTLMMMKSIMVMMAIVERANWPSLWT